MYLHYDYEERFGSPTSLATRRPLSPNLRAYLPGASCFVSLQPAQMTADPTPSTKCEAQAGRRPCLPTRAVSSLLAASYHFTLHNLPSTTTTRNGPEATLFLSTRRPSSPPLQGLPAGRTAVSYSTNSIGADVHDLTTTFTTTTATTTTTTRLLYAVLELRPPD